MSKRKKNSIGKIAQTIISIIITLGLITYLIWKYNPQHIATALSVIKPWIFFYVLGLMFLMFTVKTLRWQYILHKIDIHIKWYIALRLILVGMFGASLTPSKVGDVLRAHYLNKRIDRQEVVSYFSAILDRVMDLVSIAFFSLLFIPFFAKSLDSTMKWGIISGIAIIALIAIITLNESIVKRVLILFSRIKGRKQSTGLEPENIEKTLENPKIGKFVGNYFSNLDYFDRSSYFVIFLFSLIFWFLLGFQATGVLLGMSSINLSFQVVLTITGTTALAAVVALVPISISGMGIRDATITLLLAYNLGVLPEIALIVSFTQTIMNVILPGLIGGILILFEKRINNSSIKN